MGGNTSVRMLITAGRTFLAQSNEGLWGMDTAWSKLSLPINAASTLAEGGRVGMEQDR